MERSVYDSEIAPGLNEFSGASIKRENCHIEIQTVKVGANIDSGKETIDLGGDRVKITFKFARPAASVEDYYAFYGLWPHERDVICMENQFDRSVLADIKRCGPLPRPFELLLERAQLPTALSFKAFPIAVRQKQTDLLNGLRTGEGDKSGTVPAVLIGNAAHSLPFINNPDDLSHAVLDGVQCARLIIDARDAKGRRSNNCFKGVPRLFYEIAGPRWQEAEREWEQPFIELHRNIGTKLEWTRITKIYRRPFPELTALTPDVIEDWSPFQQLLAREHNQWLEGEQRHRNGVMRIDQFRRFKNVLPETQVKDEKAERNLVLRYTRNMG